MPKLFIVLITDFQNVIEIRKLKFIFLLEIIKV